MAKKMSLLLAAVAVLALAIPTLASASEVTNTGGGALPINSIIKGVSTNTETETETLGTLKCSSVTVEGKITTNSGGTVAATGVGTGSTSTCTRGTDSIQIEDATLLTLNATSTTSGTVTLKFKATLPGPTVCTFEGPAKVEYVSKSSSLSIGSVGEESLEGGGCGVASIHGTYALTSGGSSVVLD